MFFCKLINIYLCLHTLGFRSGWSAAVEALTAFVKSYVVPNFSSKEEGIILQPVLGYLNVYVFDMLNVINDSVPSSFFCTKFECANFVGVYHNLSLI